MVERLLLHYDGHLLPFVDATVVGVSFFYVGNECKNTSLELIAKNNSVIFRGKIPGQNCFFDTGDQVTCYDFDFTLKGLPKNYKEYFFGIQLKDEHNYMCFTENNKKSHFENDCDKFELCYVELEGKKHFKLPSYIKVINGGKED